MATWRGVAGVTMDEGLSYDPQSGMTWRRIATGQEQAIRGLADAFRTVWPEATIDVSRSQGPVWKMLVKIPFWSNQATRNDFQTEWTTGTEVVEKDIFQLPAVIAAAEAQLDPDTSKPGAIAYFRKIMEEGIAEGTAYADVDVAPANSDAQKLYTELQRGVTGWETEYQTVTRTRRAWRRAPFNRQIFTVKKLYLTAELGLPSTIAFAFQADPEDPSQALWSWRLRDQEFRLIGDKQEEIITWAYAPWSTFVYDQAGEIYT